MSKENVEVVREMNDAFNRGDYAAGLAALSPNIEWHAPSSLTIGQEVYRGRDEVRRGLARWLDAWEAYRFEPSEILDQGDHVVVTGTQTGRGRGSGVTVSLQTFTVFTLGDGKVTRMRTFDDRAAALEAAGLSQ